jgi:Protein of unknown function (DUF998)
MVRRFSAGSAVVAALLGAIGLFVATDQLELSRYVSEAGVPGGPHAELYRASVWLIAAALALLAVATRHLAFALAAPCAFVSGAVRCSAGCPLPPFETPTRGDLIHAGASIVALLLCGFLMLWCGVKPADSPLRRVARAGLLIAAPLLTASAIALAFTGRGLLTGVLERLALLATSAWLVATAATQLREPR